MTFQTRHAYLWLCVLCFLSWFQPTICSGPGRTEYSLANQSSVSTKRGLKSVHSEDEIGKWNVSTPDSTCILLKGLITLGINYTDSSNNTKIGYIDVPASAIATGSCKEHYIVLSWSNGNNSSQSLAPNSTLTIVFKANEKSKTTVEAVPSPIPAGKFAIARVASVIYKNGESFPNATNPADPFSVKLEGLAMLPTTLSHSFACYATITLGAPDKQLMVLLQNLQIEAFRRVPKGQSGDKSFSAAEHCAADEISSGSVVVTVIIAILSIVLIALAVAAVATYVLKRRRAAGVSGYQTM